MAKVSHRVETVLGSKWRSSPRCLAGGLFAAGFVVLPVTSRAADSDEGFTPIFEGRSLDGCCGDKARKQKIWNREI
jgi:hypothetical protein